MISSNSPFQIKFEDGFTLDQLIPVEKRAEIASCVAGDAMSGLITGLRVAAIAPQLAAGAVLYAGSFVINIAGALHQIRFELITTRALVAAEVLKGKSMDTEVADITIRHLYARLREINPE
jgi:hypothetical protein